MPWFTDVTNNTPNKFWIDDVDMHWATKHPCYVQLEEQPKEGTIKPKKVKKDDTNAVGE